MRRAVLLPLLLATAALAACAARQPVRTTFTVSGMHCDGCSGAISEALGAIEGVTEASADHQAGTAVAVHRPDLVPVERLSAEIESLGYTVTATRSEPLS